MIALISLEHSSQFSEPVIVEFLVSYPDTARLLEFFGIPQDRVRRNTVMNVTLTTEGLTNDHPSDYRYAGAGEQDRDSGQLSLGPID